MAQYANLIATITAAIKTNGVGAINGQLLQTILHGMVNSLGLNYQYAGIATPSTNPGSPDQRVLYLATQAGTYEHFGGAVLDGVTVHIFTYDGTWHDATLAVATKAELAAYLQIADLASGTGQSTTTTMTQKAITDALLGLAEDIETAVAQAMQEHVAKLPELVAGSSAGVLNRTVDAAFLFRRTAGAAKIGRGAAALNAIYGRTLAWNQRANCSNVSASNATASNKTTNGFDGSAEAGSAEKRYFLGTLFLNATHIYYVRFDYTSNINFSIQSIDSDSLPAASVLTRFSKIGTRLSGEYSSVYWYNYDTTSVVWDLKVRNMVCVDLTQMFGEGNEPSTVAEFEALYPGYQAYNPGALISNDAAAMETVGFNQWDEEWENGSIDPISGTNVDNPNKIRSKNYISVFPSTDYYWKIPSVSDSCHIIYYDINKNYIGYKTAYEDTDFTTPSSCYYIRFNYFATTYDYSICINLSNPAKNGTYEPYWKRVMTLALSTRTGKLNGQGASVVVFPGGLKSAGTGANMVQDKTDGITATKRVGTRAYQTGDENDATLTTDGTNTNYPLATPETYVLDEPLQMSYQVENGGTEQAIAPEGATLPSAPFMAQTQYPLDVIALQGDSLADMLDAMVAAGVITAYTMTYNVAAQKYEFTINGVSRSLPENNRKGGGNDEPNGDEPGNEPGEEQTDPGSEDPIDENPGGDIQEKQDAETVHNKK